MCIDSLSIKSSLHAYNVFFQGDGSFIKEGSIIEPC